MSVFSALTATNPAASTRSAWSVLKFGGTSVSKRSRWDAIGRLALARRDESGPVLVVVSAVSGVTNALLAIIEAAQRDVAQAKSLTEALCDKHRGFAASLDLPADAVIGQRFAELHALVVDTRAARADFGWQAEVQALGELMSSALGEAYLNPQGIPIRLDRCAPAHASHRPAQNHPVGR